MPYNFAAADTARGAAQVVLAWESVPASQHHRETLRLQAELEADVRVVASGSPPSSRLRAEVLVYQCFCLSEAPAEGYHREVARSSARSSAARAPYIFAELRFKHNVERVKDMLRKEGGPELFSELWREYKSVVRVAGRQRLGSNMLMRGVSMTKKTWQALFYRVGPYCAGDLGYVDSTWRAERETRGLALTDAGKVRREILKAVLQPDDVVTYRTTGADGSTTTTVMQVVCHFSGRERVVETYAGAGSSAEISV